jgi:predicted RNA-binding Zn ribbon-like protein
MPSTDRAWVLPEEPTPIRLMSTIWADTEGIHDDLTRPSDVDEWLDAVSIDRGRAVADGAELGDAVRLRDALRRLAAHVTDDDRAAAASAIADLDQAVAVLNQTVDRRASTHIEASGSSLVTVKHGTASPIQAALAEVASQGAALLTEGGAKLRACHAPGCVLYFLKTHPRREWCSVACGNRARAARHYERVRNQRTAASAP